MVPRKTILIILITTGIVLLIPALIMQFSNEVNWSTSDFILAGILVFFTGFAIAFFSQQLKHSKYKGLVVVLIILIALLIWVELSVGLFGTFFSGD